MKDNYFYKKILFIIVLILINLLMISLISRLNSYFIRQLFKYEIPDVSELKRDLRSIHYVNDLYISDGRYSDMDLNSGNKKIYRALLEAIKKRESSVEFEERDFYINDTDNKNDVIEKTMDKILSVMSMDHPEIIYYASTIYNLDYYPKEKKVVMKLSYIMDEGTYTKKISLIDNQINTIKLETENMSDFEKVRYVYKWICDNNVFGEENGSLSHSAYAAFVPEYSVVCEAMAKASQMIFQRIGINSVIVVGERLGVKHEWNAVKLDDKWYYFDSTMGLSGKKDVNDKVVNYEYFLFNNSNKDYIVKYNTLIQKVDGKKYINKDGMYW